MTRIDNYKHMSRLYMRVFSVYYIKELYQITKDSKYQVIKMKKIFFLVGVFLCIYSCIVTKSIPVVEKEASSRVYNLPDSLSYQVIEINNPIIYEMLDSILELSKECIFAIHEQPVRYSFYTGTKEDTISLFLYARQYAEGLVYNDNYASYGPLEKYCFVYKGIWFSGNVFPYDNESNYFSDFFKLTDQEKKLNIYFPDTEVYYWDRNCYFCFPDETSVYYNIYNNAIVKIYGHSCENIDVIYHTIKRRSTLKNIADIYRTTEKRIRKLNPQLPLEENLPVGKRIRVQ